MTDRKQVIEALDALASCGVDLAGEQQLLGGGGRVLLVAGTQGARVFDLMEGLGLKPPAWEGILISFPIQCGYGEAVRIRVEDQTGEKHNFYKTEDFCQYFEGQQETIRICRITAPVPLLRRAELRFLEIGPKTEGRLTELAGDCTGFLLALPCAAGAPGDEMRRVCQWIREERRLPERSGVVLNHTEAGVVNAMLPLFLNGWLGTKAACWQCGYPPSGKALTSRDVLHAAVEHLAADDVGETDAQTLRLCLERASEKVLARRTALEQEAEACRSSARWLAGVSKSFRASAENAGASLRCTLTLQQEKALREDVEGLTKLLDRQIPGMVQEVVEKKGAEAKDDLKNLTGDYLEMLFNTYIAALAEHICLEEWLPRVNTVFRQAVEDFRALVKDAPVHMQDSETGDQVDFLKSLSFNLGNYIDSWAAGLGAAVAAVVRRTVRIALFQFKGVGFLLVLLGVQNKVADKAGGLAASAVDSMLPPKIYGKKLSQLLQKEIGGMAPVILEIMKDSMLPAVNEHISRQYQDMVEGVCGTLYKKEKAQEARAEHLLEQAGALERQCLALPTMQ